MCGRPSLVDTKEREKKRRDVERKTRASRPRQPPIQCLQPVFDVVSSERGWRVVKKVTDERNNKSALGRITGKYRDRPGLVQLFVACYYRNVELLKKNSFAGFGLVERKWAGSSCCCCRPRFTLIPSPFSSARRGASAVFI